MSATSGNDGTMPDRQLIAWFRSGAEGRMSSLAEAEDRLTHAVSMTPDNGELARAAIEVAKRENWEATMAYVKAVGP